jgi:rod shape-determining protein MreD
VKAFMTVVLALLLLTLESVVSRYLGVSLSRVDVTVALVAFLALRASTVEGEILSLIIGYLFDVLSGNSTGLFIFLAVFLFLLARLAASFVDVRSAVGFGLFTVGCAAIHGLLAAFFSWMVSRGQGGIGLSGLPMQMLFTAVAAALLYPVLKKLDPASDRPQVGILQ